MNSPVATQTRRQLFALPFLLLGLGVTAFFLGDLLLHPLAGSRGPSVGGDGGVLFRWVACISGIVSVSVGLFVRRRVRGSVMGLVLILWGAGVAGWSIRADWGTPELTAWTTSLYYLLFFGISWPALLIFLFIFPNGQIFPAKARAIGVVLIALSAVVGAAAYLSVEQWVIDPGASLPNPVYIELLAPAQSFLVSALGLLSVIAFFFAAVSLLLRHRASTAQVRQQIKWLTWLTLIGFPLVLLSQLLTPVGTPVASSLAANQFFALFVFTYLYLLPSAATFIAILRHRLWDIDIIIRRTLVYGALTATLALIYFGGVTLIQSLFSSISGQSSTLAIVLSTLAIAALFAPLRRRIQDFIDRRFYRKKYDAQKTLEQFAAVARSETDLEALSAELVRVINETMQPESVSIWLKEVKR